MSLQALLLWIGFTVIIVSMLAFDLFVLVRRSHAIPLREATLWSLLWIAVSLLFGGGLFLFSGHEDGVAYLTGYLIEKSLSIDNIFVFLVLFEYLAVPAYLQPKVLRWGIIGALVMRLLFIFSGAALLETFHWMVFVFGAVVLLAAVRLAFQKESRVQPERNPIVRLFRRFVPVAATYESDRFVIRREGVLTATPLLIVLIVIETTDLVFAIDSIPAILSITRDTFIVYSSNAFAILGLRALYFVLAGLTGYFRYLRQGAVLILGFIGVKMLLSDVYEIPVLASLLVVAGIFAGTLALSVVARGRREAGPAAGEARELRAGG